jgi:SAM-dependent methyltransferase
LTSSITKYRWENGRRYHAYKEGEYVMPNDEYEQDRLNLQHQIYRLCLDGWLYRSPIKNPKKVLDIGTGTGIWAIDFADEYPGAAVIGTDLSPIQPSYVPPNLSFYVDDFEQPWEFGDRASFDFIHWRSLCGSTSEWSKLYGQAMANLKPGGWLEVQEYHTWVYGDDETYERAPYTQHWLKLMNDASVEFGKKYDVADMHRGWMEEAGFVDVREEVYKVGLPVERDVVIHRLALVQQDYLSFFPHYILPILCNLC